MDYFKAFETVKSSLEKSEITLKDEHLAIQVILTDEDCGGIFYIENYYTKLNVMPYDYYDNNVNVISDYKSFIELITAKKNLGALLEKITIKGDFEAAKNFFDSIKPAKKTVKKATAKKTTAKKTEEKDTEKKPAAKKTTTKKTAAKKVEAETTEVKAEPTATKSKTPAKKAPAKKAETKIATEDAKKATEKPAETSKATAEKTTK